MNSIEQAIQEFRQANTVAVVTGAGISQESGIPTFRGSGGLWKNFRAEELATPGAFRNNPQLVWEWYDWRRGICAKAAPNPAHLVLVEMEKHFREFLLITQNVDNLHLQAGNKKVIEIHGNIFKARCTVCNEIFDLTEVPLPEIPVPCKSCSELARPHIVWFGESYDSSLLDQALKFLAACDVVVVIGTAGAVTVPLYLVEQAKSAGARIIEFNLNESEFTRVTDCFISGKAGETLPDFWNSVQNV